MMPWEKELNVVPTKTRPGADCGSDHELLIAKYRLKLKKVGKTTRRLDHFLLWWSFSAWTTTRSVPVSPLTSAVPFLCAALCSVAQLCPTLCDPMGFPRQRYWSGLPFPSPGDLPNPGIEPESLTLAGRFLTTELHVFFIYPGYTYRIARPWSTCCNDYIFSSFSPLLLYQTADCYSSFQSMYLPIFSPLSHVEFDINQ